MIGLASVVWAGLSVLFLIVIIARFRVHPFLALILAAGLLGFGIGLAPADIVKTFEKGFGGVLGSAGLVVGLGAMLGGLLLDSGGADRIANAFTGSGSVRLIPVTICAAALLIGLPHLFDVSFIMLVPLVYTVAYRSRTHLLWVGLPVAAGLYVSHGLLPPHPSPTLAMTTFHADAGRTFFYGALIAVPMAILSGPVFTMLVMRGFKTVPDLAQSPLLATRASGTERPPASLGLAILTILLPPGLMMLRTFGHDLLPPGSLPVAVLDFIGDPVVSLLLAVLFAIWALGLRSGLDLAGVQKLLGRSVGPIAVVILILGAGGGFREMLVASKLADLIGRWSTQWHLDPLILAWSIAALIRIAVGSATVATITAAGIVAPLAAGQAGVSPELLVLATSSGSLMLSHVNDSGFWLFKEYFQLTVPETLRTWTLLVSCQALIGLAGVLILHSFFA